MTADPRAEVRRRIVSRLSGDEWMDKHFGIACHAGDVADAVLELFDECHIESIWDAKQVFDIVQNGPIPPASWVRIVLRTPAEEQP